MSLTPSNMIPLGTEAPAFILPDTVSGNTYSLLQLKGEEATVVMFICNHCPYVVHVNAEIVRLADSEMLRWTLDRILALPFAGPSALVFARAKLPHGSEIYPLAKAHHRTVIEAIANRQGSRAESIAREHTRLARRNLEIALTDHDFLSEVPGRVLIRTEISVNSRSADKSAKRI